MALNGKEMPMRTDFAGLKMSPPSNGKRAKNENGRYAARIDAFKERPIRRQRDGSINTGFYIKRARNVRALSLRSMVRAFVIWIWGGS